MLIRDITLVLHVQKFYPMGLGWLIVFACFLSESGYSQSHKDSVLVEQHLKSVESLLLSYDYQQAATQIESTEKFVKSIFGDSGLYFALIQCKRAEHLIAVGQKDSANFLIEQIAIIQEKLKLPRLSIAFLHLKSKIFRRESRLQEALKYVDSAIAIDRLINNHKGEENISLFY